MYTDDQQDCICSKGQPMKVEGVREESFLGFAGTSALGSDFSWCSVVYCDFVPLKYSSFYIIKHPYTILMEFLFLLSKYLISLIERYIILPQYISRVSGKISFLRKWFLRRGTTINNFLVGREERATLSWPTVEGTEHQESHCQRKQAPLSCLALWELQPMRDAVSHTDLLQPRTYH